MLLANEALKLGRRPATLVTAGFFALLVALDAGASWYGARQSAARSFALPDAWPTLITELAQVGLFFGSILVILLAQLDLVFTPLVLVGLPTTYYGVSPLAMTTFQPDLGSAALLISIALWVDVPFVLWTSSDPSLSSD